jgi:hypothetical protein
MQIRFPLASISLLAYLGAMAGCGDDIPRQGSGGSGGSTGGSMAGAGGGGSGGGGTGGSIGGSGGGTGGSIGGSGGGTGGSVGGSGGGGTGGSVGGKGGGGTGGGGTGGSTAGTGGGGSGGGGTGGSTAGTGGGGTGGSTAGTGGGGTGGSTAGTGGGGTGGSTAGTGGGGTGGAPPCYTVAFTAPTNGASLTVADDNNMNCSDGFQYTVRITTNAPDGTAVQLYNNGTQLLLASTVTNGAASFGVQLTSSGQSALSIQFPSTATCTDPSTQSTVTVSCPNTPPTCNISAPTISGTHPALNGVLAPVGDRASQIGSPYQVTFTVTTNAEDGQPVTLSFKTTGSAGAATVLNATASGGTATFGVPLSPDGTYDVSATCKNAAGVTGNTPLTSFPVDTTPPDLTVTSPASGQHLGPTDLDSQGRFKVCGRTSATDAVNLPAALGAAVNNLCVALAGSASCVATAAETAINTDACAMVPCPGGAPFDLSVTLKDAAGNPSTPVVIQGVACASTLPSVQVITPVSDAPAFNDPSKHLLNANAPVGVRDQDANTAGAQTDVVACTDRNGSASLFSGLSGQPMTTPQATVTTVAAVPADNCPSGLGFVARFPGVTLQESIENTNGSLATPTELRVVVTDAVNPASVGTSIPVDVWVDTVPPVLTLATPANLCGSFFQSSTAVTQAVTFNAENGSVILQVANGATTPTYMPSSFASGVATFAAVPFNPGQSDVTATETDPAGNQTTFPSTACSVIVGSAPVVSYNTPTAGQILCPIGSSTPGCIQDGDMNTAGWQGTVAVHVSGDGQPLTTGTVTFTVGTTTLGSGAVAIDMNGNAVLSGVTLPEGTITILATTSNIPNRGVGTGTVTVTVDMTAPSAPTGLVATIADRRKTSMQLSWTAPGDSGSAVAGYDIRYAKAQITDDTSFNAATAVTYTGIPPAPGQPDGILVDNLYIENGYFFAVKARDAAGSFSPLVATSTAVTAHFNVSLIPSPTGTNQLFGALIDGSFDVNGDGFSDLLVATVNDGHAYLFFGASNFAPTTPSVTFSSASSTFGGSVRMIGDVDDDGLQDVAISDQNSERVLIYKGRSIWPATLLDTQADYTISTDATYTSSAFGAAIAPLGDFDGDGVDDFAIGAPGFNTLKGRVAVIYGSASFASFGLPDTGRSLEIGADPALNRSELGLAVVGIGRFYTVTGGTTMVVSAPGLGSATSTSSNEGRLYAFHGRGPGAAITASAADNVKVGPGKPAKIGQTLTNLGPVVNALPSVGSGNTADTLSVAGSNGTSFVLSGTAALGPLANSLILFQQGGSAVGQVLFGGGFSGRDTVVSIIGDGKPDIGMTSLQNGNAIDIIDGNRVAGLSSPSDTRTAADVHVPLPSGWIGTAVGVGDLIRDINGDGFADFALGDQFGVVPGRVAVFW